MLILLIILLLYKPYCWSLYLFNHQEYFLCDRGCYTYLQFHILSYFLQYTVIVILGCSNLEAVHSNFPMGIKKFDIYLVA